MQFSATNTNIITNHESYTRKQKNAPHDILQLRTFIEPAPVRRDKLQFTTPLFSFALEIRRDPC
jgi:hypothetical protein